MIKNTVNIDNKDTGSTTYLQKMASPFGTLYIGASDDGLRWIKLSGHGVIQENPNTLTENVSNQLHAYFEKKLSVFDVSLDLEGYTDFSQRVWKQLMAIPYGKTISYLQLAMHLGDPKSIRAAATANGRNPIPIIIPCHRVIGSNGDLTGFALGLDVKKTLLSIENPIKFGLTQGTLSL